MMWGGGNIFFLLFPTDEMKMIQINGKMVVLEITKILFHIIVI